MLDSLMRFSCEAGLFLRSRGSGMAIGCCVFRQKKESACPYSEKVPVWISHLGRKGGTLFFEGVALGISLPAKWQVWAGLLGFTVAWRGGG